MQRTRRLISLGEDFHDEFDRLVFERSEEIAREAMDEGYEILNLMLPKGVKPKSRPTSLPRFWDKKIWDTTPDQILARSRLKTKKKLASTFTRSFKGALAGKIAPELDDSDLALDVWDSIASGIAMSGSNLDYGYALVAQAYTYNSSGEDVIDHYEHLSTLDAMTCEECAALDGTPIMAGEDVLSTEADEAEVAGLTDIHPNCRCTYVPITKSWEELGLEPMEDPEGSRIARPGYPESKVVNEYLGVDGKWKQYKGELPKQAQDDRTRTIHNWGKSAPTELKDPVTGKTLPYIQKFDKTGKLIGDNWKPGLIPTGGNQSYVPSDMRYLNWLKARSEIATGKEWEDIMKRIERIGGRS